MKKYTVFLFHAILLFSLVVIAPASPARAQEADPPAVPDCPSLDPGRIADRGYLRSLPPGCVKEYRKTMVESGIDMSEPGASMTSGGPDEFGYTFSDGMAFNWISASTKSGLTGDDAFSNPVNIGFDFPFYGISQTQLYFNTNGLITFGTGSTSPNWIDSLPSSLPPNTFIASLWTDLVVGSPYNSGAIYTMSGGTQPNRYFVVEWRNVTLYDGSPAFSFETILYENGDIVFQYQTLPSFGYYDVTSGIENSLGDDGLKSQSASLTAVRFSYPTAPVARLLIPRPVTGAFAALGKSADVTMTIYNTGSMGADVYDLTVSSTWPVTFYAGNGTTALTDGDTDGTIDTGPVPQGQAVNVIARFAIPDGAQIGDGDTASVTVTSSLDITKARTATLYVSVPPGFVNVFEDGDNAAMSFMRVYENASNVYKTTPDNYFGDDMAVARLANGNYLYAWDRTYKNSTTWVSDIEYVIVNGNGSVVQAVTKLTNHQTATQSIYDYEPAIAVTPSGVVGLTWRQYRYNSSNQYNYNVFFTILGSTTAPINITANTLWGTSNDDNISRYYSPLIAATDDNRFILVWNEGLQMKGDYIYTPYYTIRKADGSNVKSKSSLPGWSGRWFDYPTLNSLTGGKAILTWNDVTQLPNYMILDSTGLVSIPPSQIPGTTSTYQIDAVQLPNGKVGMAWSTNEGVQLAVLSPSPDYLLQSGPTIINSSYVSGSVGLSATTDAASHIIMTWGSADHPYDLYALGDSDANFVTPPMPYRHFSSYTEIGWNGQGIAPYSYSVISTFTDVPMTHPYWQDIEILYANGLTGGCQTFPLKFCPDQIMNRGQAAVFMLKGNYGSSYLPPTPVHYFKDDWTKGTWAEPWAEGMKAEGFSAGCQASPPKYCPWDQIPREQAAIFALRMKYGKTYTPPAATGTVFADMTNTSFYATPWAEQAYKDGIIPDCGMSGGKPLFCPKSLVSRGLAAYMIVRAKSLTMP